MRVVLDTNILVRATLKPHGSVGALLGALRAGRYVFLYSHETLAELVEVLRRPRMRRKYGVSEADVRALVRLLVARGERVEPGFPFRACRDPKDDKFLDAAAAGGADVLVTGDEDLLVLNPFEGIPIVRPVELMRMLD